jgi:hypothetical protein
MNLLALALLRVGETEPKSSWLDRRLERGFDGKSERD